MAAHSQVTGPPDLYILLVDDRREDLLVLKEILSAPDRELVTAQSGQEALRLLLTRDFAAIVMDLMMPGMDGFELATLIRGRRRTAEVPILFLTGVGDDVRSVYRAYDVGAVDVITKPFDPDVLRAKIRVFLDLFEKDRRIKQQTRALITAERKNKRAELAQLRLENARRYRNLVDTMSHMVWIADPRGHLTQVNRRWVEYAGSALGDSPSSWLDIIHPDDHLACADGWSAALRAGHPFEADCRLRRADGTYRWHLCRMLPETDERGVLTGWLGTHTDLDELVRARMEAEDSRRRLTFLAEVSAVLSGSLDVVKELTEFARRAVESIADACIIDVSDVDTSATLVKLSLHRGDGEPRPAERAATMFAAAAREGSSLLVSEVKADLLYNLAKSDADREVLLSLDPKSLIVVPVVSRDRSFGTITLVSSDRKRTYGADDLAMAVEVGRRAGHAVDNALLYRAVERAVLARDEFLSIASHELRTPLSALLLQLGSLEKAVAGEAVHREIVARPPAQKVAAALRHTVRLAKLVDNLLDVSRLTTKRVQLEIEQCEFRAIVNDVAERFAEELKEAKCQLIVNATDDSSGAWDRLRMEQVLSNLLSNALKYGRGGPVEITIGSDAETLHFSIRDHGIGIEEKDHVRIFNRFERAVSVRNYGGLGLGLYIVKQIVEAHGGKVAIASHEGAGTTFRVELPRFAGKPLAET